MGRRQIGKRRKGQILAGAILSEVSEDRSGRDLQIHTTQYGCALIGKVQSSYRENTIRRRLVLSCYLLTHSSNFTLQ